MDKAAHPVVLHILVAEDDELNRLLLCDILENLGYTYRAAADGTQALALYRQETFDAALLDLQMPGLDGYAVIRQIRQIEEATKSHLPIAALSGNSTNVRKFGGRSFVNPTASKSAAGLDFELPKPFYPQDVSELLAAIVEKFKIRWPGHDSSTLIAEHNPEPVAEACGQVPIKAVQELVPEDPRFAYSAADLQAILAKTSGDFDFLVTLLDRFKASAKSMVSTIQADLETGDLAAARRDAHTLKGQLAIFNAYKAMRLTESLEFIPDAGTIVDLQNTLQDISMAIDQIAATLTAFFQSERPLSQEKATEAKYD